MIQYDLASVALNIVGIKNLNRILMGKITLAQVSGQDRASIVSTETGNDVIQYHNQSKSFEVTIEVPRNHAEGMQLHSILSDFSRDGGWMTKFSVSLRVDGNVTLTSDECVLDNYDWGSDLTAPGATYNIRFKMANVIQVVQSV